MDFFDGNFGVLTTEFNEDHAAAGFEGAGHCLDHFVGVIELVIDIHHENQIDGIGGEMRVRDGAEDGFNVVDV